MVCQIDVSEDSFVLTFSQITKVVPAVTPEVKDALVKNIRRERMTPQPLKIHADVEMICFQFDGVLHIKVLFACIHAILFPSVYLIMGR